MMKKPHKDGYPPAPPHQKAKAHAISQQDYLLWKKVAATLRPLSPKGTRQSPHIQSSPINTIAMGENTGKSPKVQKMIFDKNHNENKEVIFNKNHSENNKMIFDKNHSENQNLNKKTASKNTHILPLDAKERKKIARGQLKIGARLDLHGLDSARAYDLLLHFIARSAKEGKKHVLVITGKGNSTKESNNRIWQDGGEGSGILRHSVPGWLATAPFRLYVSAVEEAGRYHGGSGALYVRLRRHQNKIS